MFKLCAIHVEVLFEFPLTCSYVFISYRCLSVAALMRLAFFCLSLSRSTCDCFGFVMCTRLHVFHVRLCVEHDGMSSAVHVGLWVHRQHLGFKKKKKKRPGCDCEVWVFFSSCSLFFFFFAIYIVHDKTNLAGKFNVYPILSGLELNFGRMGLQTSPIQ